MQKQEAQQDCHAVESKEAVSSFALYVRREG